MYLIVIETYVIPSLQKGNIIIFVVVKGSSVQNILRDKWRASFRTMSLYVVKLHKSPILQVSERPLIKAL